ncbi:MAG: glutamyl-tRNA reductase [Dehalococcoidia bacterium]
MALIAVGVNHRTAAVEERERLAVSSVELPEILGQYRRQYGNGVVLSTCNRTEVYIHLSRETAEVPPAEVMRQLANLKGLDPSRSLPRCYELQGMGVVTHLFRVAAGVDSMVLGEGQILGQVRSALRAAHEERSLDPVLSRLFHEAVRTGKRARAETRIAHYAVSVSSTAVDLVRVHVPPLRDCRALVVGAGVAGRLAARALGDCGMRRIQVTNRTESHARDLADYLGAEVVPFSSLRDTLASVDLVITSSSAPDYLIGPGMLEQALARREAPITLVDLAVPRDIDPAVADLAGVRLFDIDDLQAVSTANLRRRQEAAPDVDAIVRETARDFEAWMESRRTVPTIRALVEHADGVRRAELERTLLELGMDGQAREKLDRMTAAIVKKLLHDPIAHLRRANDPESAAQSLRRVFGIDEETRPDPADAVGRLFGVEDE